MGDVESVVPDIVVELGSSSGWSPRSSMLPPSKEGVVASVRDRLPGRARWRRARAIRFGRHIAVAGPTSVVLSGQSVAGGRTRAGEGFVTVDVGRYVRILERAR